MATVKSLWGFTENYLTVVCDITFSLLIIAKMIFGLSAKILDVKTTFLYRDFDEEVFMSCPEGLDGVTDQEALKLQKCIYVLV